MSQADLRPTPVSAPARSRLLAGLAGAVGLIHLVAVPEYLDEEPYVGVLFMIGGAALVVAAVLGYRAAGSHMAMAAWRAGALVVAGMFVGGIASRTTGLPGYHPDDWELSLLISLALEAVYLLTWLSPAESRTA